MTRVRDLYKAYRNVMVMKLDVGMEDIKRCVGRLKNRRAVERDGLKPEFNFIGTWWVVKYAICMVAQEEAVGGVIENGGQPGSLEGWKIQEEVKKRNDAKKEKAGTHSGL